MKEKKRLFSITKKDLDIQAFCVGGKGGQRRDKKKTGARVIHRASGAIGESREERSFDQNRKTAFRRMAETKKFQLWVKKEAGRIAGVEDEIEANVEKMMQPENFRIEGKDENGRWVKLDN